MKSVTINDVAKQAGVSKKTVSRVINNEANVRAEMKEKVQAAIDLLGFKRNPLGLALANNRSYSIALLSENSNSGYLMSLQKGILLGCTEQSMGLFLYDCSYRSPTLLTDVQNIINNSFVDGFILAPPICDKQEVIDLLEKKKISYIRISPKNEDSGEFVGFNVTKAAYDMVEYLLKLDHKDVGFILGHPDQESSHRCERGYRSAFKHAGTPVNETLIVAGDYSYQSGIDGCAVLLSQPEQPSVIFASNDEMALGALYEAQERGIKVPEQLSICGIDNISFTNKVFPNITTMNHPIFEIGHQAARLLITRLQNKTSSQLIGGEHAPHIFDCDLVERDSTMHFTI